MEGDSGVREEAVVTVYLSGVLKYVEGRGQQTGLAGGKARHSWEWENPALSDNLVCGMREGGPFGGRLGG